ncbi:glycosyltransferase [Leuconostoc lactis]|uniref:glycosyltransferase family 2 protein n=1 Tax=Leuconostoc lactis TaxID=1246 RepID=UPI0015F6316B|nr:glycosyltransferase family 2 protein [Leuconostoc lactis]MBA5812982.1 glycosyltransferase [Leuconostoc lactis]
MNDELISVVVPVYNVEDYLGEALDSLINQTYKNIEVIIVDDGSTDSSGEIADTYAKGNPNFRVYHFPNQGVSEARNFGLKNSNGKYLFFLDPDDVIDEELFEIAISNMAKNNTDLFLMNFNYITEDGKIQRKNRDVSDRLNLISSSEQLMKEFVLDNVGSFIWQFVIRKSILINDGLFHEFENMKYYEDVVWVPKTIQLANKVSVSSRYLYNYRQRDGSSTDIATMQSIIDRQVGMQKTNELIMKDYPSLVEDLEKWNLVTSIHIYTLCTYLKKQNEESKVMLKNAKKNISKSKNFKHFKHLTFAYKVKYLFIISGLFSTIYTVRKVKRIILK